MVSGGSLNSRRISDALSALVQRSNNDCFVIFTERDTSKFVQFAHNLPTGLYLDLPVQGLSTAALERATKYFRRRGVDGPTEHEAYATDGSSETYSSFNMTLGDDVRLASRITLDVFSEVYQFPNDFVLLLTEN